KRTVTSPLMMKKGMLMFFVFTIALKRLPLAFHQFLMILGKSGTAPYFSKENVDVANHPTS
ncbi:MAG: hypothetical protein ABIJ57_16955, partial [Pseudomonadota bacterium]